MGVIFENMLRNVCANKRRSVAFIICMMVVGFSAVFTFSIYGAVKDTVYGIITQAVGDTQILVKNPSSAETKLDLPEGVEPFYMTNGELEAYTRSAENFVYPTHKRFMISGMDILAAQEKGLIRQKDVTLGENEIIITEEMAHEMNYKVGSVIKAKDVFLDSPISLTVAKIISSKGYFQNFQAYAAADTELVNKLSGSKGWNYCFVKTNGDIEGTMEYIKEHNPDYSIENLYEGLEEQVQQIFLLFMGIFIVLVLILLFVSSGMSKHIVRERMSELGTLRSIGATKMSAALMLVLENLFYGFTGAVLGILLYIPLSKPIVELFMGSDGSFEINCNIHVMSVMIALVVTVLVSCLSAIKAILGAVKTPIRDIIFGNQNTSYTLSKSKSVVGIFLLAIGLLCGFISTNPFAIITGLAAFVAGLAMSIPIAVTVVCKLFKNCRNPIAKLALKNIHTKKMIVSSTVLYAIVAGLVSAVIMLSVGISELTRLDENAGDIIILQMSKKTKEYSFISQLDGVDEAEFVYKHDEYVKINGELLGEEAPVIGYNKPFSIYQGVEGLPNKIGKDEVFLDKKLMNQLHISKGDCVEITLNAKGKRPVTLKLTAAGECDTNAATLNVRNGIVISLEKYKHIYYDYPATELVRLEDPQRAEEFSQKIKTLMMDKYAKVYTAQEYFSLREESGVIGMLYMIVMIGCVMMLILMATNNSISFEQRRREFAILHSTSMSRTQLKKMLFSETVVSLFISTVVAFGSAMLLYVMIFRFVNSITGEEQDILPYIIQPVLFLILLYPVTLLIVKRTVKKIDKINTAAQMKYE
ncbi:MAG: FtsX-like permease family protein [Lachnospiraceae bacterium]|nr:FtsX-like permease family protein [Lachnospiraceae bacterium]